MIYVFGKFIPFPLRYVQFLFDFWPFEAISHIQYVGYTTLVLGPYIPAYSLRCNCAYKDKSDLTGSSSLLFI